MAPFLLLTSSMSVPPLARSLLRRWAPSCVAFALAACTPVDLDPGTVSGELGNGVFRYDCDSSARRCDSNGSAPEFPARIAVGTRFSLSYEPNGYTSRVSLDLEPVSTSYLEVRDDGWSVLREGVAGILSRNASGDVYDYMYVELVAANSVRYFSADVPEEGGQDGSWVPLADMTLEQGARKQLVVEPLTRQGDPVAGEPLLEFSCDKPVVSLDKPLTRPRRYTLTANAEGEARCTLRALGQVQEFAVTVRSGSTPPPNDAGTDAGSDAAIDSDAGDAEVPL